MRPPPSPAPQAQIAEGAWVLALDTPTIPPATATNTLILGGDRLVVIEPATPHPRERARLDALLGHLLAEGRTLAGIAITHHHSDHIGYAPHLRARYEVPIYAHAQTAARLDFGIDHAIDEGWTLELGGGQRLEALYTPGHAPGHLVLREQRSGLSHVGDLVAGEGSILIDPRDSGDMGEYLDSLRRMKRELHAELEQGHSPRFVPAHGPVLDDPLALVEHYIRHRLAREDKVRAAVLEQGRWAFPGILASVYADTPKKLWPFAALALEAHLQKLVEDGELRRVGKGARAVE